MATEAQKRAIEKYQKNNIKRVVIKLNKKTDQDIIEYIDKIEKGNVQTIIKKLIRKDMEDGIY